jgi:hypothetical protein
MQPMLSPDGTRVAVQGTGTGNIWTFDVASGKRTPVTTVTSPGGSPIWSRDGSQVAYVSERGGDLVGIYRKAWDGSGNEEQLFQDSTPGGGGVLTDWSTDGKFLTFFNTGAGVLLVVPLSGNNALERKAIDWLRDEYYVLHGLFSPDSRYMAYRSNEFKTNEEIDAGIFDVYVRPFDAAKPEAPAGGATAVRVSTAGALGMIFWRQDGKEMYYLTRDWEVMAVEVTTTPSFTAGTPRLLFKLPGPLAGDGQRQWSNASHDGQRFVFAITVPAEGTPAR